MNLFEALNEEISRNEELLRAYQEIPEGVFGATCIKVALDRAKKARSEGDAIQMMRSWEELKENN